MLSKDLIFALRASLREEVEQVLQKAASRAERAEKEAKYLRELLQLERIKKYGPASEKLNDAQLELLGEEPGVHPRRCNWKPNCRSRRKKWQGGARCAGASRACPRICPGKKC